MGRHRMLRRWNNGVEGTLQNSSVTSENGEPRGLTPNGRPLGVTKAGEATVY